MGWQFIYIEHIWTDDDLNLGAASKFIAKPVLKKLRMPHVFFSLIDVRKDSWFLLAMETILNQVNKIRI